MLASDFKSNIVAIRFLKRDSLILRSLDDLSQVNSFAGFLSLKKALLKIRFEKTPAKDLVALLKEGRLSLRAKRPIAILISLGEVFDLDSLLSLGFVNLKDDFIALGALEQARNRAGDEFQAHIREARNIASKGQGHLLTDRIQAFSDGRIAHFQGSQCIESILIDSNQSTNLTNSFAQAGEGAGLELAGSQKLAISFNLRKHLAGSVRLLMDGLETLNVKVRQGFGLLACPAFLSSGNRATARSLHAQGFFLRGPLLNPLPLSVSCNDLLQLELLLVSFLHIASQRDKQLDLLGLDLGVLRKLNGLLPKLLGREGVIGLFDCWFLSRLAFSLSFVSFLTRLTPFTCTRLGREGKLVLNTLGLGLLVKAIHDIFHLHLATYNGLAQGGDLPRSCLWQHDEEGFSNPSQPIVVHSREHLLEVFVLLALRIDAK